MFGLHQGDEEMDFFLQRITDTFSLQMFDPKVEKLLIHSDGWKQAVKLFTDAVCSKAIVFSSQGQGDDINVFVKGKAAMTVANYKLASALEGKKWGMVTAPVDLKTPDESGHVGVYEIYAISADSPNKRAAWEFIKFINGPEVAKRLSHPIIFGLPTRNQFLKEVNGRSAEPFYMLKPKSHKPTDAWYSDEYVPTGFRDLFHPLLTKALEAIVDNKKTVDEALTELEVKGQDALVKVRKAWEKGRSPGTKANNK